MEAARDAKLKNKDGTWKKDLALSEEEIEEVKKSYV